VLGFTANMRAEAPMARFQVPGFYRMMLGNFEITALCDGFLDLDAKRLRNAPEAEINGLLDRMYAGAPRPLTAVNCYLVNTGSKLVLIDTGGGALFGPALGSLTTNLAAAGYSPAQIDVVLITHMHRDHIGGLVDAAGKPVFPRAAVMVSKAENDYWLSDSEAEKAPPGVKKFFDHARRIAAAYTVSGKWQTFGSGQLLPGIKASVVPGHTPGHCIFEISSGDRSLVVFGDTVHCMAVQFSRPEISFEYDWDPKQAVSARCDLFRNIAERKVLAAGMHVPFPGIGRVLADGKGGYTWVPVEFSPI
jgi:glyoxylase-like metal-dependent hydrolase (beta-lactamase superfamily II)